MTEYGACQKLPAERNPTSEDYCFPETSPFVVMQEASGMLRVKYFLIIFFIGRISPVVFCCIFFDLHQNRCG